MINISELKKIKTNKKLFMMALCMVGHSGYAVESNANMNQQPNTYMQDVESKLWNSVSWMNNTKNEIWDHASRNLRGFDWSHYLDQVEMVQAQVEAMWTHFQDTKQIYASPHTEQIEQLTRDFEAARQQLTDMWNRADNWVAPYLPQRVANRPQAEQQVVQQYQHYLQQYRQQFQQQQYQQQREKSPFVSLFPPPSEWGREEKLDNGIQEMNAMQKAFAKVGKKARKMMAHVEAKEKSYQSNPFSDFNHSGLKSAYAKAEEALTDYDNVLQQMRDLEQKRNITFKNAENAREQMEHAKEPKEYREKKKEYTEKNQEYSKTEKEYSGKVKDFWRKRKEFKNKKNELRNRTDKAKWNDEAETYIDRLNKVSSAHAKQLMNASNKLFRLRVWGEGDAREALKDAQKVIDDSNMARAQIEKDGMEYSRTTDRLKEKLGLDSNLQHASHIIDNQIDYWDSVMKSLMMDMVELQKPLPKWEEDQRNDALANSESDESEEHSMAEVLPPLMPMMPQNDLE